MSEPLPIEAKYPITDPSKIQLYSMNTPNGVKVAAALEELELPYEAHLVHIGRGDQHDPAYRWISPNGKIPAMLDPDGPGGAPLALMESGAILLHLAEKTGRLLPRDPIERSNCVQWLFFQVGHIGPMFGQFGHFHRFARGRTTDNYALARYLGETRRLLGVLEGRLLGRPQLGGESYSIADVAVFPWVNTLLDFYEAGDVVGMHEFPRVKAWLDACLERPASQVALQVCRPD